METRVHGGVAMDCGSRTQHRNPLDHRSLWERLAKVSPSEGVLPIDANANAELLHVTANTGLCRASPHSQVPKEMEEELQSQLCHALDHGSVIPLSDTVPGPVTGRHEWTWTAIEASGGLFAVVYQQSGESQTPAAAFAAGMGKRGLLSWEAVWQSGPPPNTQWPKPPLWKTEAPRVCRLSVAHIAFLRTPATSRRKGLLAGHVSEVRGLGLVPSCSAFTTGTDCHSYRKPHREALVSCDHPFLNRRATVWRLSRADGPLLRSTKRPAWWNPALPSVFGHQVLSSSAGLVGDGNGSSGRGRVRIDRPPDQSAWALHSDLDDYVESVLAAAVETYWREQGRVVG